MNNLKILGMVFVAGGIAVILAVFNLLAHETPNSLCNPEVLANDLQGYVDSLRRDNNGAVLKVSVLAASFAYRCALAGNSIIVTDGAVYIVVTPEPLRPPPVTPQPTPNPAQPPQPLQPVPTVAGIPLPSYEPVYPPGYDPGLDPCPGALCLEG